MFLSGIHSGLPIETFGSDGKSINVKFKFLDSPGDSSKSDEPESIRNFVFIFLKELK
jgi:hypothetical protein